LLAKDIEPSLLRDDASSMQALALEPPQSRYADLPPLSDTDDFLMIISRHIIRCCRLMKLMPSSMPLSRKSMPFVISVDVMPI